MKAMRRWAALHKAHFFVGAVVALLLLQGMYYFAASDSRCVVVLFSVQILFCVGLYIWYTISTRRGSAKVEHYFIVTLIFLGCSYLLFFPPGSVPDEGYHFRMSYLLSNNLGFINSPDGSMMMRGDDASFFTNQLLFNTNVSFDRWGALADNFSLFASSSSYVSVPTLYTYDFGANPPQIKIVSAVGILIAKALNLGSIPLFYMGRLFNFAFFVVLVYFAVRLIPFGKKTMMVAALLPMTLHVAASYSYDAGIIALAFLLTSLCLRAIYGKGNISLKLCISIAVVLMLLAPCKVIYVLIALSLLLVPSKRFPSKGKAMAFKIGLLGCALLMILLTRFASLAQLSGVAMPGSTADGLSHRIDETGHFYTLSGILSDPINTVLIFLRTLDHVGSFYLTTLVGGSLGCFQANLIAPFYIVAPFIVIVVLSTFRSTDDKQVLPLSHRLLFSAIFGAGVVAVMTSMLLGWTFETETVIQGVQGRYFLPLLPLFLLALRTRKFWMESDMTFWFVFGMAGLNGAYLVELMVASISG